MEPWCVCVSMGSLLDADKCLIFLFLIAFASHGAVSHSDGRSAAARYGGGAKRVHGQAVTRDVLVFLPFLCRAPTFNSRGGGRAHKEPVDDLLFTSLSRRHAPLIPCHRFEATKNVIVPD